MQVEMSLGELLINAIAHGKIPGVQFKRGWSKERETFDGLKAVIEDRLDGARRVAVESALFKLRDEHPHFKALRRIKELEAVLEEIADGIGCDSKYGPGCDTHCKTLARRAMPSNTIGEEAKK